MNTVNKMKTIHYCSLCDYETNRKWDRDRHMKNKHLTSYNRVRIRAPNSVSHQFVSNESNPYQNLNQVGHAIPMNQNNINMQSLSVYHQRPVQVGGNSDCPCILNHQSNRVEMNGEGFTRSQFNRIVKVDEKGNHHEQKASNNQNYIQIKNLNILSRSDNIEYLLNHRKEFLGCFPSDKLPEFPTEFPKSMIINTDKTNQPGDHWVALVLTKDKCYYFDSMGMPILEENIMNYIEPHYNDIKYSNSRIQDLKSNKCGAFCVCFVLFVTNDKTFKNFLKLFSEKNLSSNDEILNELIQDIIFIE